MPLIRVQGKERRSCAGHGRFITLNTGHFNRDIRHSRPPLGPLSSAPPILQVPAQIALPPRCRAPGSQGPEPPTDWKIRECAKPLLVPARSWSSINQIIHSHPGPEISAPLEPQLLQEQEPSKRHRPASLPLSRSLSSELCESAGTGRSSSPVLLIDLILRSRAFFLITPPGSGRSARLGHEDKLPATATATNRSSSQPFSGSRNVEQRERGARRIWKKGIVVLAGPWHTRTHTRTHAAHAAGPG